MNLLKSRIIQGTLLLTVAGFITHILGFFYRIFLADKLGAAVLGSYQLIFPYLRSAPQSMAPVFKQLFPNSLLQNKANVLNFVLLTLRLRKV